MVLDEIVEQLVVAHHAAHRHRAVVSVGILLDGHAGDVAAHRRAGEVDAARVADEPVEPGAQVMRVLDSLRHVVAVGGVARRGPGKAVLDEIPAERRVADGQLEAAAAKPVRVEHELAVPVGGHFDAVAGAALHAPQARGRGAAEGIEGQPGFIDKVLRRFVGLERRRAQAGHHEHEHGGDEAGHRPRRETFWNGDEPVVLHVPSLPCDWSS